MTNVAIASPYLVKPTWLGTTGMNVRDALIHQGPSLALQRAASDLIASLDTALEESEKKNRALEEANSKLVLIVATLKGKKQ